MPNHEYKVIPAPNRPEKAKGAKSTAEKFALALNTFMNDYGRDGWEYVRAETLPCEVRKGWFGRSETSFQTLLVFRRELSDRPGVIEPAVAKPEKVVRRLWARDSSAATPEVVPAPQPATRAPAIGLNAAAVEGNAPRIFASIPERPADRPAQD